MQQKFYTLETLYQEYPEWRNLEIVIYSINGCYKYVGNEFCEGSVYIGHDERKKVLVFSEN